MLTRRAPGNLRMSAAGAAPPFLPLRIIRFFPTSPHRNPDSRKSTWPICTGGYRRRWGDPKRRSKWKLGNVSAVLEEPGIARIPGAAPANYQDSLVEAVEAQLGQHPK